MRITNTSQKNHDFETNNLQKQKYKQLERSRTQKENLTTLNVCLL